jgi:hypothetical protein
MVVLAGAAIAVAACSGKSRSNTASANDDLKRDLELASSPRMELAGAQNQRQQVVSAIERVAAPVAGHTAPRYRPHADPTPAPAEVTAAPDPSPTTVATAPEPQPEPQPTAQQPVSGPSPSDAPVAGARPQAPVIAEGPAPSEGRDRGGWGGGWGGVVIRGGGVDGDHCDPRGAHGRHGGMNGGIGGFPIGLPIGGVVIGMGRGGIVINR